MENQQNQYVGEDEIDLRKYINVIIRRKKLILGIFIAAVVITAIISLQMPKVYKISTLIEPPVIGINNAGGPVFADSTLSIKARIDAGAFDSNIIKALELDPRKPGIKVHISELKDSTLLNISLNKPESEKELGIKILSQYLKELTNFYESAIEFKRKEIDRQISFTSNGIKNTNNSIKLNEESIKIVEVREKELMDELKSAKVNTEQLLTKRDGLLEKKAPENDMSSLLYTNTIQQNIAYFNQLNNQIAGNKTTKESMANTIKTQLNDINNSNMEIERLKAVKESIRNIKLVNEPQASFKPVGSNRTQNVILAGMLSLMFGVFLAFVLEFLQKNKA